MTRHLPPPAQTLDTPLAALRLEEAGGEQDPWQRLLGSIRLAGVDCHVEAIAVRHLPDDFVCQQAIAGDLARALNLVADAFDSQGGFRTLKLKGSDGQDHDYVLVVHPYDR
jgi:hypothetical protein